MSVNYLYTNIPNFLEWRMNIYGEGTFKCTPMIKPNFISIWEFIIGFCKMELCKPTLRKIVIQIMEESFLCSYIVIGVVFFLDTYIDLSLLLFQKIQTPAKRCPNSQYQEFGESNVILFIIICDFHWTTFVKYFLVEEPIFWGNNWTKMIQ